MALEQEARSGRRALVTFARGRGAHRAESRITVFAGKPACAKWRGDRRDDKDGHCGDDR